MALSSLWAIRAEIRGVETVRVQPGIARRLWRCRWHVLRIAVAAFLLWVVAADLSAQAARRALAALPGFDYIGEVQSLRKEGRYGEALAIADAGLEDFVDGGKPVDAASLKKLRDEVESEQGSLVRRVKDVGWGAISGRGDTIESLVGAIAADLFVIGDVRDLLIEGGKWIIGGEPDPLIAALSAAGLITTLAPEIDWVPSLLKAARKTGALTKSFGEWMLKALRASDTAAAKRSMTNIAHLAEHTAPGGAMRVMKNVHTAEDLTRLATFAERRGKSGALALHVAGKESLDVLTEADKLGLKAADPALVDGVLVKAARKGEAGRKWLATGAWRAAAKPHPLIGLAKGVYKGNATALIQRMLDALGPKAWWLLPLLAAWLMVELAWLSFRIRPVGRVHPGETRYPGNPGARRGEQLAAR